MPVHPRLYAILAREAPYAVVFRRGPSKSVLVLRWNTETDTFEEGQWLKGRIYERRCDLSPDGTLLIYFAANYKKPLLSWTAVSRMPYLTALALWPKGDGWGGGGHFEARDRIALNHRDDELALAEGFRVPKWMTVTQFGAHPGWGEDNPIWAARLERDGWTLISEGKIARRDFGGKVWIEFDPPMIWEKRELQMIVRGIKERGGAWYIIDHVAGDRVIEKSDWADWLPNGDLAYAKNGALYRMSHPHGEPRQIIDLNDRTFEARESPPEARVWPNAP
jgi:hypothetical protein